MNEGNMTMAKRRAAGAKKRTGARKAKMTIKADCVFLRRAPMEKAVACALKGIKRGGGPFGACVSDLEGKIIACASNSVLPDKNPTHHAEINAISAACKKLGTHALDEHILYTTTEPCLMCRGAAYWAKMPIIVYGTNQKDAKRLGFDELNLTDGQFLKIAARKQIIATEFMRKECLGIFAHFRRRRGKLY